MVRGEDDNLQFSFIWRNVPDVLISSIFISNAPPLSFRIHSRNNSRERENWRETPLAAKLLFNSLGRRLRKCNRWNFANYPMYSS